MEKVLFGNGVGQGIIFNSDIDLKSHINPTSVFIGNETIYAGQMTSMQCFFYIDILYLGMLKDDKYTCLCFELGREKDLFTEKIYVTAIYKITDKRLFKKYALHSGRDFNYIKGKWK